jgi:hypothetical protein
MGGTMKIKDSKEFPYLVRIYIKGQPRNFLAKSTQLRSVLYKQKQETFNKLEAPCVLYKRTPDGIVFEKRFETDNEITSYNMKH